MCSRINVLVILVFMCSFFDPCVNIYNYSRTKAVFTDSNGCETEISSIPIDAYFPTITRSIAVVADLLVFIITWMKTAGIWKASRNMKQFRPKLTMLLLRDGTIYFGALTVMNLLTVALDVVARIHPELVKAANCVYITQTLSSLLIARFILDLRMVFHPHSYDNTEHEVGISNIRFSAFAAPIGSDSVWVTGGADYIGARE